MTGKTESESYDEQAAIDAAQERSAVPHLREVLKREHDDILKGRPRNVALKNWGSEIEAWIQDALYKRD